MAEPPAPDDVPTSPEIPSLRCPQCSGKTFVFDVEVYQAGYRAIKVTCPTCKGEGLVDRHVFGNFHATSQGRPPPDTIL